MLYAPAMLTFPLRFARSVWTGWQEGGHLLGMIVSAVVLSALWVTAFAAYAIAFRLSGRKDMEGWVDVRTRDERLRYSF